MAQKIKKLIKLGQSKIGMNVAQEGNVTVIYGIHQLDKLNLVGKTVGQVRDQLSGALNIDPKAENLIAGEKVDEKYVIKENDTLEFVKLAGSKG